MILRAGLLVVNKRGTRQCKYKANSERLDLLSWYPKNTWNYPTLNSCGINYHIDDRKDGDEYFEGKITLCP